MFMHIRNTRFNRDPFNSFGGEISGHIDRRILSPLRYSTSYTFCDGRMRVNLN